MLKIGNLSIDHWCLMAPMSGITNLAFRLIVKRFGVGMVATEMVSAMGLTLGKKKTIKYLKSKTEERPLSVQLFGSRPKIMAEAAAIVSEAGADVVDINMGCPARKVVKTGSGGALMRAPKKVEEIVSSVRSACNVPLTVKIRSGWSPEKLSAPVIARLAEDCGADAITVHPRFVTQGFSGHADWDIIERVKGKVKIPVIGNGDIITAWDAFEMRLRTGCDAVMIGRAAVGNPWIFKQIIDIEKDQEPSSPILEERRCVIMDHFDLLSNLIGEGRAARNMRGLLLSYTKGLPHSRRFRQDFTSIKDLPSLVTGLDRYFDYLRDMIIES